MVYVRHDVRASEEGQLSQPYRPTVSPPSDPSGITYRLVVSSASNERPRSAGQVPEATRCHRRGPRGKKHDGGTDALPPRCATPWWTTGAMVSGLPHAPWRPRP